MKILKNGTFILNQYKWLYTSIILCVFHRTGEVEWSAVKREVLALVLVKRALINRAEVLFALQAGKPNFSVFFVQKCWLLAHGLQLACHMTVRFHLRYSAYLNRFGESVIGFVLIHMRLAVSIILQGFECSAWIPWVKAPLTMPDQNAISSRWAGLHTLGLDVSINRCSCKPC